MTDNSKKELKTYITETCTTNEDIPKRKSDRELKNTDNRKFQMLNYITNKDLSVMQYVFESHFGFTLDKNSVQFMTHFL